MSVLADLEGDIQEYTDQKMFYQIASGEVKIVGKVSQFFLMQEFYEKQRGGKADLLRDILKSMTDGSTLLTRKPTTWSVSRGG